MSIESEPTAQKRVNPNQVNKPAKKLKIKKYKPAPVDATSPEGVLRKNIFEVFPNATPNDMTEFMNRDRTKEWPLHREAFNLEIKSLSHNGNGIAINEVNNKVVLVPFTYPGDVVNAQIHRTEEYYLEGLITKIVKPSEFRNDSLVKCQYFGKCGGCQYQNTSYDNQLEIKRQVIVNAYRYLAPDLKIPEIRKTVASPQRFNYRTKLTPHFDVPKRGLQDDSFPIGFGQKGNRYDVIDIEECPIGTEVVNQGIKQERQKIKENYKSYKRGATVLLREGSDKTLITNPKQIMKETVGDFVFEYKAGEFFQNNNCILPVVTDFVAENLKIDGKPPQFLVDTYCGCGLFAITCSKNAEKVIGVEISAQNVEFARKNAETNSISNAEFIVGQAEKIFDNVNYAPDQTSVVIDPPRKGCDELFLNQLLAFGPAKIVYVSCNVHSQARDLDYFMKNCRGQYEISSLGGFDFFPQTYHVEGVAVLTKVK